MKSEHMMVRGAVKALAPILALMALSSLTQGGSGLAAGLMLAALIAMHAIVFGAAAAARAIGPFALCAGASLTLIFAAIAVCAPHWTYAALMGEAALCAGIAAAFGLAFQVLAARAPTLREEEW